MRLALIQFNATIGALDRNAAAIAARASEAMAAGADLVVFPELSLTGYPPRDLLWQEAFLEEVEREARKLAGVLDSAGCAVIIGAPWRAGAPPGAGASGLVGRLTNSLLVLRGGTIEARYDKRLLPAYDVFDEERYFRAGVQPVVIEVAGVSVGLSVCEDLWKGADASAHARYASAADPVAELCEAGARVIINPSASPFVMGKASLQREIAARHVRERGVSIAMVNQVGANDDLIFDGRACVLAPGPDGAEPTTLARGRAFQEEIVFCDLPHDPGAARPLTPPPEPEPEEQLWGALTLGVRDYCRKTGFQSCVLGLSGGVDSAVVACIAVAALGADHVLGVAMPSRFSSPGSVSDADALALTLRVRMLTVPLESSHAAMELTLQPAFEMLAPGVTPGLAEENVQARLRGLILMGISNKTGAILLTTGNKSELAVGYCTLYGDMNGGLAPLSDVRKMDVYRLARWINQRHDAAGFAQPPIPQASIDKPPSAELRPDQTDQDSLPPYELLDQIVERYVEKRQSPQQIVRETGIEAALVGRIVRLIDISEHKRRQMPVGLKVSPVAFGPGRRLPIAQAFGHPRS